MRIWMCVVSAMACGVAAALPWKVADSWVLSKVPSGFPVGFSLLTQGDRQYAAYFDQDHRMTVASRTTDAGQWIYQVLPSKVGWDSHNYITMAVDDVGQLHVAGNMHASPLVYFRTRVAGDIRTLERLPMTGEREKRATYPKFMRDQRGRLIFNYRDGGSGRGVTLYNVYDPVAASWSRLLDVPLLDSEGETNAYPLGPVRGPDGWFHMAWVWRDTPDCSTNHHLSYARSKDLLEWESAFGDKARVPITQGQRALWVDPVPSGGGLINGGAKLVFDSRQRPMICYHKADAEGNMQVYVARPEGSKWNRQVVSDWDKPVRFSGGGSLGFVGIRLSDVRKVGQDLWAIGYRHKDYGEGMLMLDEQTLRPVSRRVNLPQELPAELNRKRSGDPGMAIRRAMDSGSSGDPRVRYLLQWETLEANRDRKRDGPVPEPATLVLYKLVDAP